MPGAVAGAQDAPNPHIAALLPPAREINGLNVRITAAGFGSIEGEGGFNFSYEVTAPNADLSAEKLDSLVSLTGLFAPNGTPLTHSAYQKPQRFYFEVTPQWKNVRAEFEVRNPALPESAATGRETTHYEPENIALPAMPITPDQITMSAPDAIKFVTPRGTRLELVKLTREKQGEGSKVAALWKWIAPQNTPGMSAEIESMNVAYFGVQNGSVRALGENYVFPEQRKKEGEIEFDINNVPAEAQALNFAFDFAESARQWRQAATTQRVSFEIPVAALWQIAPLKPRVPLVSPVVARNDEFEATWETREHKEDYNDDLHARLWVRDLAPQLDSAVWTFKAARLEAGANSRDLQLYTENSDSVFHLDNSLVKPAESGVSLPLRNPQNLPARADVTVTAQRARTILTAHVLKDVPLPPPDGMIEFKRGEFFDGVWHLRRVLWLQGQKLRDELQTSEPSLFLTFELDPSAYLEDDNMEIQNEVFYDEKGEVDYDSFAFFKGDFYDPDGKHHKDRVMLILNLPAPGTKRLSGNFQVRQRVWSGLEKTLVLRDVPLRAKSENPGAQN